MKRVANKMNEKNGTVLPFDDMDVMAFANKNFKEALVDRLKKHEVDEGKMLYRLGNGQDDDILHITIDSEGSYTSYAPNIYGAMKKVSSGVFKNWLTLKLM